MRRVAIIGSGISGLAVAHGLQGQANVTLFEAGNYFGGHTHTVDVTLDGHTHGVDTGFLVLNERTYPRLLKLFEQLGVEIAPSDMSFSVQVPDIGLEWSGSDLSSVFAQRSNLFKPRFWRMLRDILRFNKLTTAIASTGSEEQMVQPIFGVEERACLDPVLGAAFRELADVAAGAEAAAFAVIDDHRLDTIVAAPFQQCFDHRLAHREVQRVDRLGTVERDAANAAGLRDENIFGHWRSKSLPTIIRIT